MIVITYGLGTHPSRPNHRQGQTKNRTSAGPVLCRPPAAMGFDDRACDRQSHSHAALLGRKKRLEDLLQDIGSNPRAIVGNRQLGRIIVEEARCEP